MFWVRFWPCSETTKQRAERLHQKTLGDMKAVIFLYCSPDFFSVDYLYLKSFFYLELIILLGLRHTEWSISLFTNAQQKGGGCARNFQSAWVCTGTLLFPWSLFVRYRYLSCFTCMKRFIIFSVSMVRKMFPDPDGKYTNWKPPTKKKK
jgi:hypothetical protein